MSYLYDIGITVCKRVASKLEEASVTVTLSFVTVMPACDLGAAYTVADIRTQ